MTKEDKLAEEWLDERYLKDMGVRKPYKEAFLAGFEAGREIEKQRRMTNKELSRWLREKPTREYKDTNNFSSIVYSNYSYMETESSDKVPDNILIREDDDEWREPFVEVEE